MLGREVLHASKSPGLLGRACRNMEMIIKNGPGMLTVQDQSLVVEIVTILGRAT